MKVALAGDAHKPIDDVILRGIWATNAACGSHSMSWRAPRRCSGHPRGGKCTVCEPQHGFEEPQGGAYSAKVCISREIGGI